MIHDLNKVPSPIRKCAPTGSRYICTPPPMDTDEDYVVLVKRFSDYANMLEREGWDVSTDDSEYLVHENDEIEFMTARKGELNLIIYQSSEGYDLFCKATSLAFRLNIKDKKLRVDLFKAILNGRAERTGLCS